MSIALCVVSMIYGGLSLIAAISQMRSEKKLFPAIMMIVGSVILITAAGLNFAEERFDYVFALVGCASICAAAMYNGIKSGNFHIQHHIIRIALSVILTIGFVLL